MADSAFIQHYKHVTGQDHGGSDPITGALHFLIPQKPSDIGKPNINDLLAKDQHIHLSALLEQTGWGPKNGDDNRIARMVVGAESGYNPKVYNGSCCVGFFQMNLNHAGQFGIPAGKAEARTWLEDPVNNATSARKLFESIGGDWHSNAAAQTWETIRNKKYLLYSGRDPLITIKKTAFGTPIGDAIDKGSDAVSNSPLAMIGKLIGALFDPSTYFRIGKGVLGYTLIVGGVAAILFVIANKVISGSGGVVNSPAGKVIKGVVK